MKILKNLKNILSILILASFIVMLSTSQSSAALQANPNTQYKTEKNTTDWLRHIRYMEAQNGTMGLSETINGDLTSTNSNNIDVHMMRSTEYGAIAILSASAYGNPSNAAIITTTTGNDTGVILRTTGNDQSTIELVAAGLSIPSGVNNRYFDIYTSSRDSAKAGDALGTASTINPGCYKWRNKSGSWIISSHPYFERGGPTIFYSSITLNSSAYSRGVAVCRQGM